MFSGSGKALVKNPTNKGGEAVFAEGENFEHTSMRGNVLYYHITLRRK